MPSLDVDELDLDELDVDEVVEDSTDDVVGQRVQRVQYRDGTRIDSGNGDGVVGEGSVVRRGIFNGARENSGAHCGRRG